MTNRKLTDITLVIDASPSMIGQKAETIAGVNSFVQEQLKAAKESGTEVKVNLVTFSNYSTHLEGNVLTPYNYSPETGHGTALYDAAGAAIKASGERFAFMPENLRPGKVLVVIVTDGEENSSRAYTREQVHALIKKQTAEYSWDFVFMGANQDAWQVGSQLGFIGTKTMSYAQNHLGVQAAFVSASNYAVAVTRSFDANMASQTSFNASDIGAQNKAGLDTSHLQVPDSLKTGT
jgi:uncharacterized protein YegL